ncbi:hypothetical protein TNCV_2641951 [Trichonephila clavipes]|nr:hypothetical protein TNCV_2641951 [Trichonephila clavipes]
MPRKRKSNLSQRSNSARAMKVDRFNETFPQAELRSGLNRRNDAPHSDAETPERSQPRRRRQAEYLAFNGLPGDTRTVPSSASSACNLLVVSEEIQKPLKQLNSETCCC